MPLSAPSAPPPALAGGVPVLRRDRDHLQVGLDPAVVLRDSPDVRDLLDALRTGATEPPGSPAARAALARLGDAGLLAPVVRRGPRRVATVALDAPPDARAAVTATLRRAGLEVRPPDDPDPASADCLLVVRDGVVARGDLDAAMRSGLPHLVVAADHAATRVGPFVVPGTTACLRCVDAHRGARDPRWAVLVEQAARQPGPPRDAVRHAIATSWAAGDLRRWVEGGMPSTWSATLALDEGLGLTREEWTRHPACGCAWGALDASTA